MKKIILILLASALALSLLACGGKKEESETPDAPDDVDTDVTVPEGEDKPDEEDDFVLDVKETATTMTWQIGSITYVFEHDGTNVTGMESYVDCDTPELAQGTLKNVMVLYDEDPTIKLVEAKGKYIHYVMNEEGFLYRTVEELNTAKSILENAADGETAND